MFVGSEISMWYFNGPPASCQIPSETMCNLSGALSELTISLSERKKKLIDNSAKEKRREK